MTDARFEDGHEAPLNLGALDTEDLAVISALVQDGVFPVPEMRWDKAARRFVLLINRFRWEEGPARAASPERVRALLVFDAVTAVASSGIDRSDPDMVLSLLSVDFEPTDPPAGQVLLTLAGDGAIRLQVEALEVTLKDVTKPYMAPSGKTPDHPD
ncbi:DUF2948 family protein [Roseobacter sinensis]|uniref:DUF2948 family protein n=1 Tax=Roseobacter sinensis TaxID=2931391 RepID=A0ABT3BLR6_9RHOB|nr:DUF2948 family protein [Roseobacter sp. WL0113]MCV3274344.1 DUF2948 family protein [Roseobacter sp. WL0113]